MGTVDAGRPPRWLRWWLRWLVVVEVAKVADQYLSSRIPTRIDHDWAFLVYMAIILSPTSYLPQALRCHPAVKVGKLFLLLPRRPRRKREPTKEKPKETEHSRERGSTPPPPPRPPRRRPLPLLVVGGRLSPSTQPLRRGGRTAPRFHL